MNLVKRLLGLWALIIAVPLKAAPLVDWQPWQSLLQKAVHIQRAGQVSQVDYTYLATQQAVISQVLAAAAKPSRAQFDQASRDEQLAFLINLYNLATVDLVLSGFPKAASIKDLGTFLTSPWKLERVQLFGSATSLDHIEHGLIRGSGRYQDPRIHFAVNCASIGCPPLREEAYVAERLDGQLQEQALRFLADRNRNRLTDKTLQLSSIFKWYGDDFAKGWRGATSLPSFLALYSEALGLNDTQRQALLQDKLKIEFLPYDWGLNHWPGKR